MFLGKRTLKKFSLKLNFKSVKVIWACVSMWPRGAFVCGVRELTEVTWYFIFINETDSTSCIHNTSCNWLNLWIKTDVQCVDEETLKRSLNYVYFEQKIWLHLNHRKLISFYCWRYLVNTRLDHKHRTISP